MQQPEDRLLASYALDYRERIVRLAREHAFGVHLGGSLSLTEILTVLYFSVARVDPEKPSWPDRDRIILSKGHGNVGLLTALSLRGFFPASSFDTFNALGSHYTMHADSHVPGVEHSAGSLGHGLSVAVGMALAGRLDGADWKVYCILGDGESMEGSVWEALMSAGHFGLENLVAILDYNRLTQEGTTDQVMDLEPIGAKVEAFGWRVFDVAGHDVAALRHALQAPTNGKPTFIVANTVKGYGVPSHQNQVHSHFGALSEEQLTAALEIIEQERGRLAAAGD
jgi:transketolase